MRCCEIGLQGERGVQSVARTGAIVFHEHELREAEFWQRICRVYGRGAFICRSCLFIRALDIHSRQIAIHLREKEPILVIGRVDRNGVEPMLDRLLQRRLELRCRRGVLRVGVLHELREAHDAELGRSAVSTVVVWRDDKRFPQCASCSRHVVGRLVQVCRAVYENI